MGALYSACQQDHEHNRSAPQAIPTKVAAVNFELTQRTQITTGTDRCVSLMY